MESPVASIFGCEIKDYSFQLFSCVLSVDPNKDCILFRSSTSVYHLSTMEEYESLSQADDELEDPILDHNTKRGGRHSRSPYLWFGSGFLGAVVIILMLTLSDRVMRRRVSPIGLIPDFPTVEVVFEPHAEFSNLTDPITTRRWHDMLHHGHVFVSDASRFSLKPGIPVSKHGERLIVSGLHGLHCLRTLRNEMTMLILGHALETGTRHKAHNHPGRPDHCFDYLRQLIMCNLDLTYEPARVDLDGERRVADGWGIAHQCKDWSAINDWMLKNIEWEMSMDDWHAPDTHKPPGQDEEYGEVYPLYSPLYNNTACAHH